MEIREQIKVLRAFKRGSIIEYYNENSKMWLEIGNNRFTAFNFSRVRYRIKPRLTYIPFTWDDRELFRGKWARWKHQEKEFTIDCIVPEGLCFNGALFTYEHLLGTLEFIDGSKFGKIQ